MITPLSQGALTTLGVFGMAGDSPFREAVDQVLSLKNFKDKSEWEAAVQELFGSSESGGSPFVPMYELFLSRTEYGSIDYEEVEDEDPLLKDFISTEDKCKYKNVYPFLETHESAYDHFSYPRPIVLRRILNRMRAMEITKGGRTLIFFPETYDLVLPTAIRRSYYRRLRTALSPFLSFGRFQVILPSQLPFVQQEIDRNLGEAFVRSYNESNGSESEPEYDGGNVPDDIASDELVRGTLQLNYRVFTRFALHAVRRLSTLSKVFFEKIADKYKDDPRGFIKAVHYFMEPIVYSSVMNPSFIPLFVVERSNSDNNDRYRAKLIATLLLFRHYAMSVDPLYTGMFSREIVRSAAFGRSSIPRVSSLGASLNIGKDFVALVREVFSNMLSGKVPGPIDAPLTRTERRFFRVPASSVFDKGVISVFSGPSFAGGSINVTTISVSLDFATVPHSYVKAILDYAEENLDSNDTSSIESMAISLLNRGFGS